MLVQASFKTEAHFVAVLDLTEDQIKEIKNKLTKRNAILGGDETNEWIIKEVTNLDNGFEFDFISIDDIDIEELRIDKFNDQNMPNSAHTTPLIKLKS